MTAPLASIRIELVEDYALLSALIRSFIERNSRHVVIGEATNRDEAIALAASGRPDIILLDLYLGDDNAIDFLPQLQAAAPEAKVLLITWADDIGLLRRAVQYGARGIVCKREGSTDTLLKAIDKVYAGEMWFDRRLIGEMIETTLLNQERQVKIGASLTAREREIVGLLCTGLSNKALGNRLGISDVTVRHHLTSVFSKLGVSDRVSLVVYALQHGLNAPHV